MARQIASAAINAARDAHYELNPVTGLYERTLLLEGARTNLVLRSQEFDHALWAKSAGLTVTTDAAVAPDGTTSADSLTSDGTAVGIAANGAIGFTDDGEKVASIFLKAGSATSTQLSIYDATTGAHRRVCAVAWASGVPTIGVSGGTGGTAYPVVALGNGWYRISFSAQGVIAANNNRLLVYPASQLAVAGSVYAWGAQAEDATFSSSYIPTTTAAVTRAADNLSFPFTLPPQEMTVYAKFIERGTIGMAAATRIMNIGNVNPVFCLDTSGTGFYRVRVHNGTTGTGAVALSAPAIGDLVELQGVYKADGSLVLGQSINGAAEATWTTAAISVPAAWGSQHLHIGSLNGASNGFAAFQSVKVARGTKTLAEMRAL